MMNNDTSSSDQTMWGSLRLARKVMRATTAGAQRITSQ